MSAEKYIPSPEDYQKADEMMTEEERQLSKEREEVFVAGFESAKQGKELAPTPEELQNEHVPNKFEEEEIIKFIGSVDVPHITEPFFPHLLFSSKRGRNGWIIRPDKNFKFYILYEDSLSSQFPLKEIGDASPTLNYFEVTNDISALTIEGKLKGRNKVNLSQIYKLITIQLRGEPGALLTDGGINEFWYSNRVVSVVWNSKGWDLYAPDPSKVTFKTGSRIFLPKN